MTKKDKYYLTTAIPYVNANPHIGHALEYIIADAIHRYHELIGKDVFFVSGADENALKNVQAAEKASMNPTEFLDKYSSIFEKFYEQLECNLDEFRRGTDKEKHHPGVQELWKLADKNGDIYKKTYKGLYCVGCEEFKQEKDLENGKCPNHDKPPEEVEEENYFFKLSNYQDKLIQLIESDTYKITPQKRKNEILSFIKGGLEDFSISRSNERARGFGVSVPGDDTQKMYVWFDALNIYMTGVGFGYDDKLWKKWWPADLHIIGKDIIRFHAVYWPAMLISAGLPLPKELLVHGFITSDGRKMSKSLGNVIDPFEVMDKYGVEATRYILLGHIPTLSDGDLTEARIDEIYNAYLVNGLGNYVSRVVGLMKKYTEGIVPKVKEDPDSHPLRVDESIHNWKKSYADLDEGFSTYNLDKSLRSIWDFITEADKYINESKPWELDLKKDKEKIDWIVYGLAESVHHVAWQILPFLPETAKKIAKAFKIEGILKENPNYKDSWTNIEAGTRIELESPLFPRLG